MHRTEDEEKVGHQERVLAWHILEAIRGIKYGSVQITIHDSRVVQIDKTEKVRLRKEKEAPENSRPETGRRFEQ